MLVAKPLMVVPSLTNPDVTLSTMFAKDVLPMLIVLLIKPIVKMMDLAEIADLKLMLLANVLMTVLLPAEATGTVILLPEFV